MHTTTVVGVLALAAGCSSGRSASADAETCARVADAHIIVLNDLLTQTDGLNPKVLADAGETSDVFAAVADEQAALDVRADELGCTDEELAELICDRVDLLERGSDTADALRDHACSRR